MRILHEIVFQKPIMTEQQAVILWNVTEVPYWILEIALFGVLELCTNKLQSSYTKDLPRFVLNIPSSKEENPKCGNIKPNLQAFLPRNFSQSHSIHRAQGIMERFSFIGPNNQDLTSPEGCNSSACVKELSDGASKSKSFS